MNRERGFTLLELAMVSVIVIIMGLIVIPRIASFINVRDLETEGKKLRAKIRETQQLAITKQKTYRLKFDLDNESYDIEYDPGTGSYTLVEPVKLESGIDINSTTFTSNTVSFDYFGAPSQAGNIVLRDSKGNTSTIDIASATGRVKIQ